MPARSDGGQHHHIGRETGREIGPVPEAHEMTSGGLSLAGMRRIIELEVELAELRRQIAQAEPARVHVI